MFTFLEYTVTASPTFCHSIALLFVPSVALVLFMGRAVPTAPKMADTAAYTTVTAVEKPDTTATKPIQQPQTPIAYGISGNPLGPWEPWALGV